MRMNETPRGSGKFARVHQWKRRWLAAVTCMAALVVFCTVYALVMPATALEKKTYCGMEEHTHDDSCYESVLICEQEEGSGHVHDESCYEQELTCGKTEHTHTDECYVEPVSENSAAEETETGAETEAAAMPDGAQVPDGYTQQYTARDDANGFAVTVYAPEGAVPDGATLSAELLTEDDDAYLTAEEALAENNADTQSEDSEDAESDYGFAAMDIHFEDANGNEVEPDGDVYVVIDAAGLLPEGADTESITVQHRVEKDNGDVTVETVADTADETDGVVVAQADEENENSGVQAAFEVKSFSTFTITWRSGSTTYFKVTVHYVDENGNAIQGTQNGSLTITNNGMHTFADYDGDIDGYTYLDAHYASYDGSITTYMKASQSGSSNNRIRYLTFFNGDDQKIGQLTRRNNDVTQTADVYLVYKENIPTGFYIKDTIATDGLFTASFGGNITIPENATVEYTWYRSLTGMDSSWEEVTIERVTGTQDNIVNNGASVNVAYDSIAANAKESDRYWYYVKAVVTDSEGYQREYTADPLQVPYYIELQNGSFESPVSTHWNNQLPNGTDDLIWQTTGEGTGDHEGADIEIVRSTDQTFRDGKTLKTYQKKVEEIYSPSAAEDGVQFAELNCEAYGALYQDVMTIPGADLYWYLSHCARQGNDEMALVIMAADKAEELTSALEGATTSQQIRNILGQYDNDAYIEYFTDGTKNWKNYSGTYTVPEGQYLTRFFFVAVSTGSGNNTVGNLLDDVGFTSTPRAPEEDQGQLTVTKVVDGYFPDNNYSVDITVTDGKSSIVGGHRLSNFTIQSDGTYAASYTFTFDNMTAYDMTQYTVSESVVGSPTDYTETSTVSVGENDAESGTSVKATVTAGETQTVTFTNSYEVNVTIDPVDPEIRKYVYDNKNGTYDLSLDVTGTTVKETKKINVLYILDESYSMMWDMNGKFPDDGNNRSGDKQTDSDGKKYTYSYERYRAALSAIEQLNSTLSNNSGLDVQTALVEFAKTTRGTTDWTTINGLKLPSAEYKSFETGTNYGAALNSAANLLQSLPNDRSDAETIVIFVTDGTPDRDTIEGNGSKCTADKGIEFAKGYIDDLDVDSFYAIGVSDDIGLGYLQDLIGAVKEGVDASAFQSNQTSSLVTYFAQIAAEITGSVTKDAIIVDELSEYAELVNVGASPVITITNAAGNPVEVTSNRDGSKTVNGVYTETFSFSDLTQYGDENATSQTLTYKYYPAGQYSYSDGTTNTYPVITLEFPDKYELTQNWTYTITVQIKPTQAAVDYIPAEGTSDYPHTGDPDTDADENYTSSNKPGFNANTEANLIYENGSEETEEKTYPHPVIQVTVTNLTFQKVDLDKKTPLSGATFVLYKMDNSTGEELYYTDNNGTITWQGNIDVAHKFTTTDQEACKFTVENLVIGQTYYLRETVAPTGYQLPEHDIKITWTGNSASVQWDTTGGTPIETNDGIYLVPNSTGAVLPSTGGPGTTYVTIGGLLLMAAAVGGGYGLRRRRGREGR